MTSRSFEFLMCKCTLFEKHVSRRYQEQEITWLYITLLFDQTCQMLVLLSFTTETNLFSRAARVMSLNSAGGPQNKKIPSLNTLETRAGRGWAVKRALRSSFNVWCAVGLARALFPHLRCAWRPAKFYFLQTGNPIFFL